MNIKDLVFTRENLNFKKDDVIFNARDERGNLHFKKDDVIFNERDEEEKMYFIYSGDVQLVKTIDDVDINIAKLSAGDFFGEMALITGSRRVASAIAYTDCTLHVMDKETFMSNVTNNRDFLDRVLVSLARRLEEIDLNFAALFKMVSKSYKP